MDLMHVPSYEELERTYTDFFDFPVCGCNITKKFELISLVCRLTDLIKRKKPDVTHWTILYQLNQKGSCGVEEGVLKGFAVVCSSFAYGCSEFPNFGVEDKDIPKKIIEYLKNWLPF